MPRSMDTSAGRERATGRTCAAGCGWLRLAAGVRLAGVAAEIVRDREIAKLTIIKNPLAYCRRRSTHYMGGDIYIISPPCICKMGAP